MVLQSNLFWSQWPSNNACMAPQTHSAPFSVCMRITRLPQSLFNTINPLEWSQFVRFKEKTAVWVKITMSCYIKREAQVTLNLILNGLILLLVPHRMWSLVSWMKTCLSVWHTEGRDKASLFDNVGIRTRCAAWDRSESVLTLSILHSVTLSNMHYSIL